METNVDTLHYLMIPRNSNSTLQNCCWISLNYSKQCCYLISPSCYSTDPRPEPRMTNAQSCSKRRWMTSARCCWIDPRPEPRMTRWVHRLAGRNCSRRRHMPPKEQVQNPVKSASCRYSSYSTILNVVKKTKVTRWVTFIKLVYLVERLFFLLVFCRNFREILCFVSSDFPCFNQRLRKVLLPLQV